MVRRRVVVLAATVLALAGCGGHRTHESSGTRSPGTVSTSVSASPTADTRKAIASTYVTPSDSNWHDVRVDLVALNRLGDDDLVVQLRLTNESDAATTIVWDEIADFMQGDEKWHWASGIGVLDTASRELLLPYRTADGGCLCTGEHDQPGGPGSDDQTIAPHGSWTLYAVTPAPAGGARTTTVVTPIAPPLTGVPISADAPTPPPGQRIRGRDGVQTTTLKYPIETPEESLDKSEEIIDRGRRVEVNLSADVLFELNKAELSGKAHAILARTARRIDDAGATTVDVDGYTDSSGDDRINDPLSRRRADAVRKELARLVHGGVTFVVAGHGSRHPLYPNSTSEGRRHNRRVAVSFTKTRTTRSTADPSSRPAVKKSATFEGVPFSVELTGLRRLTDDLGVLTYRITDEGDKDGQAPVSGIDVDDDAWLQLEAHGASGVFAVDAAEHLRYPAARFVSQNGTKRYCACTQTSGVRLFTELYKPHQSKELWSLIELPGPTDTVDVEIGRFPKLTSVRVG
ncbi:MAG TPA: OmpA family protein [Streptosporangiales bacterium]